eukprot:m.127373 g.127373  ORF g.127373 m.127373 type:complete len:635 (-) comp14544_c2_seq1:25-1929(-)
MGCCCSSDNQIDDFKTKDTEKDVLNVALFGTGYQGKSTFLKQASIAFRGWNSRELSYHKERIQSNLLQGAVVLLDFSGVRAWSQSNFVQKLLQDRFQVKMSQEDAMALIEPMSASVRAYLAAFDQALLKEGYRRPLGDDPGKMPRVLEQKFSLVAGDDALQVCKLARDPKSEDFLEEALGLARMAQDELKVKVIGVSWPSRDRETGDTGVKANPCPWVDEAFDPGLKTKERVVAKAVYKYDGNFGRVRDISRLALQFESFERLAGALETIREKVPVLIEIENRFANPTVLGWRDITILLEITLSDGVRHICEVQLHHKNMSDARKEAHKHYRTIREILQRNVPAKQQSGVVEVILGQIQDSKEWWGPLAWLHEHKNDYEFNDHKKGLEVLNEVWAIDAVQNAFKDYEQRREVMEMDSFEYFMSRREKILSRDYQPTKQDALQSYTRTTGMYNEEFEIPTDYGRRSMRLWDTGGQRSERKKWVHIIKEVQVVLFVANVTDYDMPLFEGGEPNNRLYDSLKCFEQLVEKLEEKAKIVLVFTHIDMLPEKEKQIPMQNVDLWREEFSTFSNAITSGSEGRTPADVIIDFMESKYLEKAAPEKIVGKFRINTLETDDVEKILKHVASLPLDLAEAGLI